MSTETGSVQTAITDWLSNVTHFGYDADGNLTSEKFPSSTNVSANFTYNAADELTRIVDSRMTGSDPFRWAFGYCRDALGQVSSTTDQLPGLRQSYGYNALNQLTSDTTSSRAQTTWSYDGAGNITGMQDTGSNLTESFGYDSGDNQLTSLQATGNNPFNETYSYNADGDRTGTSGTQSATYGYDQADELTSFTQGSTSASYAYNGDGLRMSKTVNGTAEGYVWDEAEGMPLIIQDANSKYITGPGGLPIEQVDGSGTVSYYLQDQLGSTRGLIDGSGTIVGTYQFGAYGNLESHTGASTPFGYAGQYTDAETGFQYLRARYYDPVTDQFITADPLVGLTGQPYGYSPGDLLDSVDPYGLFCIGSICSDSVTNAAGNAFSFIGQNAGTIVPVAVYGGFLLGAVACATVTFGLCVSADVAVGGLLFGGGALAVGVAQGFAGDPIEGCQYVGLEEPEVSDPKLQNLINQIYKGARTLNPIGTGSMADAVRYELRTGVQVGGRWHSQKAGDMARALSNWLGKHPDASASDQQAAKAVLQDLLNALAGR